MERIVFAVQYFGWVFERNIAIGIGIAGIDIALSVVAPLLESLCFTVSVRAYKFLNDQFPATAFSVVLNKATLQ